MASCEDSIIELFYIIQSIYHKNKQKDSVIIISNL